MKKILNLLALIYILAIISIAKSLFQYEITRSPVDSTGIEQIIEW